MGRNDMDHLRHLETVALSDCAVLESKEATYQGSWKRAGGRSAWFMARRNLDRLITMMSPKDFPDYVKTFENVRDTVRSLDATVQQTTTPLPGTVEATRAILEMLLDSYTSEDIFMKIREKPNGEDGTVLACLRDARRYFMLVEAEMIAEGVVEPESKTYEQNVDPYLVVAEENGMDVVQLKECLLDWKHPLASSSKKVASPAPQPLSSDANGGGQYAAERAAQKHIHLSSDFDKVLSNGKVHEKGRWPRDPQPTDFHSSDGGAHATEQNPLWPWQATADEFAAIVARTGVGIANEFYSRRAADVYQLEPVVVSRECPKELYPAYEYVAGQLWVLRRDRVPAELDDNFPRLPRELNMKEHEDSPALYQFMYLQDASDQKFKIQDRWQSWGKEAA